MVSRSAKFVENSTPSTRRIVPRINQRRQPVLKILSAFRNSRNSRLLGNLPLPIQFHKIGELLLFFTILAGALVSGTEAGLSYNNFPYMGDGFFDHLIMKEVGYSIAPNNSKLVLLCLNRIPLNAFVHS